MNVIPIDVEPEEVLIRADRRLSFEVVSAFRSPGANPVPSIRVLDRWDEENRLLAEFSSPVPLLFSITRTLKTVELVTFLEPARIEFELTEPSGILRLLQDSFILEDAEGWTRFRYESRFGIAGWVPGWALGKLVFESMFKQHMRRHLAELRETIEARAMRSRQYPLPQNGLTKSG
jgi:hypothetical protein